MVYNPIPQVLPYIAASAGAIHLLCASELGRVKISWPTKDKDAFYRYKYRAMYTVHHKGR
jgi:hypothetical protein